MNEEYRSLLANDTWDLVPLPKGQKLVRCKWVYRTKYGPDGKVDNHKARLVAKGFSQVEGIDYTETFSPVAKMNSIRLVFSLAASLKWEVHQMDVKSAFLHGDLHEEIYMEQPLASSKQTPAFAEASPLLVGFTNSDWIGDPDDRNSTASYVFTLGSGPITWACKKQGAVSLSSAEAEYHGAVEASKEALWLRQILSDFGFQHQHPTTLWCDNQSAIQLCKDPVQHQRSKHIELHMHFIRKLIHDHVLEVQYCSTDDQVADIFTKALTEAKLTKLRYMLGVRKLSLRGDRL
eukprot:PITA_21612